MSVFTIQIITFVLGRHVCRILTRLCKKSPCWPTWGRVSNLPCFSNRCKSYPDACTLDSLYNLLNLFCFIHPGALVSALDKVLFVSSIIVYFWFFIVRRKLMVYLFFFNCISYIIFPNILSVRYCMDIQLTRTKAGISRSGTISEKPIKLKHHHSSVLHWSQWEGWWIQYSVRNLIHHFIIKV